MRHNLSFSVSPPDTLADVIDRLDCDTTLDDQVKREMRSAVNVVAKFADLPPAGVNVDIPELRRVFEKVQPRRFNMTARRLANVRSLLVKALVRSGYPVEPLRLNAPLAPAWAALMQMLELQNDRNALTRFVQWCSLRGIAPDEIGDEVVEEYREALTTRSFVKNAEKLGQNLVRSWNRAAEQIDGWPSGRLTVTNRRQMFLLPLRTFPESFQRDLEAWCARLAGADLLDDQPFKPLRPVTVDFHRQHIRRCASALVHEGFPTEQIVSLATLIEPANVKIILKWFLARNEGNKPSQQTHLVSGILLAIGRHWVDLDEQSLRTLESYCSRCRVKSVGMTRKNRDTLRLFDDPRLVSDLLKLPARLMRRATQGDKLSRLDAYLAAQALAIGILMNAPIRIENLANINLDRNIIRQGTGRNASVSLWFPAQEVKNDLEIELPLAAETVHLLDSYMNKVWPVLAAPGCTDLFPGRSGQKRSKVGLGMAIAKTTERELGVRISPHQFRHITGYLYLKACPGDYETVRVLLGHKSLQTTIQFYAGMEIAAAAKRYDEVVLAPGRKVKRGAY